MPRFTRQSIPYIQQDTQFDCGAAALAMVLAHHGKHVGIRDVREIVGAGRDGADLLAIVEAAEAYGLHAQALRVPVDELSDLPVGSVLHWEFRHFVVLERVMGDVVVVVDPAAGRRRVPLPMFRQCFTGAALVFEPGESFELEPLQPRSYRRYFQYLRKETYVLIRVLAIAVLLQLLALTLPVMTGLVVDRVVPTHDYNLLSVFLLGLVAIVVFKFLSEILRSQSLLYLRTRLDEQFTDDFLKHLVSLPYSFFQLRSAGDIIMRLNSNAQIRKILTAGAMSALMDGGLVVVYLVLLFVASGPLGLLVLALSALQVLLFLMTRKKHGELTSEVLESEAQSRGYQVEMLAGIETLKATATEQRAAEHWTNLFLKNLNVSVRRGQLEAWYTSLLNTLHMSSPLIILGISVYFVLEGQLSLGLALALNALAAGFLGPLSQLMMTAVEFQHLGSYLSRIDDVFDSEPEENPEEVTIVEHLDGRIELENVSFRYGPRSPLAVDDVSFRIEPGQFIAIVGKSGSGKSTLARLIGGLFKPTSGVVYFDGHRLGELSLSSVRSRIGTVTQDAHLFGMSIQMNLSLIDPNLAVSELINAAKLSCIHDDIAAMPMGYDTIIGERGLSISGGQRQRLALARALVTRPSILILDEATSQIDSILESRIQKNIESLQCTRIIIAHRLSTVQNADRILVMRDGSIVEHGTHQELVALDGEYAEMVGAQALAPKKS